MIGYEAATRQAALEQAAKDKIWSAAERKVLQALADGEGFDENVGTGRVYWLPGHRIRFYIHESTVGYNIGRCGK